MSKELVEYLVEVATCVPSNELEFSLPVFHLEIFGDSSLEGLICKRANYKTHELVGKTVTINIIGSLRERIPAYAGIELVKSVMRLLDKGIRVEFNYKD